MDLTTHIYCVDCEHCILPCEFQEDYLCRVHTHTVGPDYVVGFREFEKATDLEPSRVDGGSFGYRDENPS